MTELGQIFSFRSIPERENLGLGLDFQVASAFGGLELKSKERVEKNEKSSSEAQKLEVIRAGTGEQRDSLLTPSSVGPSLEPAFRGGVGNFPGGALPNGATEHRGILRAPFKANGEHQVGIGGPRGGPGDFWGGDMPIGDGWGTENWEGGGGWDGGRSGAPSMNALGFLKSMVAACLLDHSIALPVESGAIYHRLVAKDMNLMERDAITEVGGGGETGGVAAVELALHSLADGPYGGGIEIDEFIVAGMPHLMVVNFDRARLLKELPGGHPAHRMGDPHHRGGDPHLMSMGLGHGMDTNSGPLGMPARPPEMWVCGGEPRMQGGAPLAGPGSPMFPGGGGPPHMVPRGGPRGMGMLGMPGGGMGFGGLPSPFQRPPMGPGPHGLPGVKNRGGEEDDIDALLNKKSFKELQQSKTGEELLELLHRPTAKETAVAAKVGFEQNEGHHCIVLSGVHMLHDFDQRL